MNLVAASQAVFSADRIRILLLALLGIGLHCSVAPVASAYVRTCKVDFGGRDLEIDVNKDIFEKYGIDPLELRLALARAGREWYTRGGLPYRIKVNSTYTTAVTPASGHVLVIASETQVTGKLADAFVDCPDGNIITFYVQSFPFARGFVQDSRSGGTHNSQGPVKSIYRTAAHELGHVLGMDHSSGDPMMSGDPLPFGLAWDDINGLRSGTCTSGTTDSAGNNITCKNCTQISGNNYDCSYGVSTSKTLKAMYSNNDGTSWSENHSNFTNPGAATNVDPSHAFGYDNNGSATYGVAYVRATSTGDDRVRVISGTGTSWPNDVDIGGASTFGPAIAYGNSGAGTTGGWWVAAFVDRNSSPTNQLRYSTVQTPSGTWTSPATVTISSTTYQGVTRPYLTFARTGGRFVLAWASRDSTQIFQAVGYPDTNGAIAWTAQSAVGGLDINGGAVACVAGFGANPTTSDCLLAWPHAGSDYPIMSARGWTNPAFSNNFKIGPAKQVASEATTTAVGVALKPNTTSGGTQLAMLAFRAWGSPWNWVVTSKSTTSQLTAWPAATAPSGGASGLWSGVSMAYSTNTWNEWSSVYSR